MLPTSDIQARFANTPPDLMDIYLELRSLIKQAAPGVCEVFHSRGTSYYYPEKGGPVSAGVCQVAVRPDHIQLGFVHGAFLPDPAHLLSGKQLAMRHVRLVGFDTIPWNDIHNLISWSNRFDPYTQQFRED